MQDQALTEAEYVLVARIGWAMLLLVTLIIVVVGAYLGYTSRADSLAYAF